MAREDLIARNLSVARPNGVYRAASGWVIGYPCACMANFVYQPMLPLGDDLTEYRLVTKDYVSCVEALGQTFVKVEPEALRKLTYEAMRDIAHLLRASHLAQLREICVDPGASENDKFVALDMLKNAVIAAEGILPQCQDTGTAIVVGKKGQYIYTGINDSQAIARGVFDAYAQNNLRYSQVAPLDMYREVNTGTNLPAQIDLYATNNDEYHFLFMAKGGGSANKTFLYQETKALLSPEALLPFLDAKIRSLGTAACPPYHLGIAIGGTSAEEALKVSKLASTRFLDSLPTQGNENGHAVRCPDLEAQVLVLAQQTGIGAQFGGKDFCHDVRVIRLPRHAASCPVAISVSCSADRQALGKITRRGIFWNSWRLTQASTCPTSPQESCQQRSCNSI